MMRWIFAVLFFGLVIASYVLHPLPMMRTDAPAVRHVADLPAGTNMAIFEKSLDYYGAGIPAPGGPDPAKGEKPTRPAIGFAYREVSMLGLPFVAYKGYGLVVYSRGHKRIDILPLDEKAMAQVEAVTRRPLPRDYRFPFWLHIWGWVIAAIGGAWAWWELQDIERRKEAAGII